MDTLFQQEPQILKQMLHRYLFQAEVLPSIGLYQGKLGVVIFFYYYGRYAHDHLYTQLADELLDQVTNNISIESSVGFGCGMSGIAWGVHHLIENNFVEGDVNELFSELDTYIMQRDLRRIVDISFDSGLSGINHYIETRLKYAKINNLCVPFDEMYLSDMGVVKKRYNLECCVDSCVCYKIWSNLKLALDNESKGGVV